MSLNTACKSSNATQERNGLGRCPAAGLGKKGIKPPAASHCAARTFDGEQWEAALVLQVLGKGCRTAPATAVTSPDGVLYLFAVLLSLDREGLWIHCLDTALSQFIHSSFTTDNPSLTSWVQGVGILNS